MYNYGCCLTKQNKKEQKLFFYLNNKKKTNTHTQTHTHNKLQLFKLPVLTRDENCM